MDFTPGLVFMLAVFAIVVIVGTVRRWRQERRTGRPQEKIETKPGNM